MDKDKMEMFNDTIKLYEQLNPNLSEKELQDLSLNLNPKYLEDKYNPTHDFYTLFNFGSCIFDVFNLGTLNGTNLGCPLT